MVTNISFGIGRDDNEFHGTTASGSQQSDVESKAKLTATLGQLLKKQNEQADPDCSCLMETKKMRGGNKNIRS